MSISAQAIGPTLLRARVTHTQSFLQRAALVAAVLLMVCSNSWRFADQFAGIDFYQFWIVPSILESYSDKDIYDGADRLFLGQQYASLIAEGAPNLVGSESSKWRAELVSANRTDLELWSTPFLYLSHAPFHTGDYQKDYRNYAVVGALATALGLLLLTRVAGMSTAAGLVAVLMVTMCMEAYFSDIRVGNVNRLLLGLISVYIALVVKSRSALQLFGASVCLALIAMIKPVVAFVVPSLMVLRLGRAQYKEFVFELGGVACGVALAAFSSMLYFGDGMIWLRWLQGAPGLASLAADRPGNYPVSLFLSEILTGSPLIYQLGVPAVVLAVLAGLAVVGTKKYGGLSVPRSVDQRMVLLHVGIGLLLFLMASGLVWYHYFLLALPLVVAILAPSLGIGASWYHLVRQAVGLCVALLVSGEVARQFEVYSSDHSTHWVLSIGLLLLMIAALVEVAVLHLGQGVEGGLDRTAAA